jgi:hypothetical protein
VRKCYNGLVWLLALGWAAGLSACGGSGKGSPPTQTAQAERASRLATQIAAGLRATRSANAAQATVVARSIALAANTWPVALRDDFLVPANDWPTGDDTDPLADIEWRYASGRYIWKATAHDSFVWWATPGMDEFGDGYLAVSLRQSEGETSGEAGLVFHQQGDSDYYLFEINHEGQYAVYLHLNGDWQALIDWQDSAAILPDAMNRLAVFTQADQFYFFINRQLVDEVSDSSLTYGQAGLLIGLSNPDDQGAWEFDDFEVRVSPEVLAEMTPTP